MSFVCLCFAEVCIFTGKAIYSPWHFALKGCTKVGINKNNVQAVRGKNDLFDPEGFSGRNETGRPFPERPAVEVIYEFGYGSAVPLFSYKRFRPFSCAGSVTSTMLMA